ncbi:MAG: oxidoreductase [Acidobacteriota bacterium]|nr:oxidoreductase [Acidobacteriota bacterium]MDQ3417429.1 oxidoreductase [Acidobacteriota bacterium]
MAAVTPRAATSPRPRLTRGTALLAAALAMAIDGVAPTVQGQDRAVEPVKLITLDPGHFHAALIQKEMYPGVSDVVHVYAPVGTDLVAHMNRIAQFNERAERPTRWQLEVHSAPDFFERMLRERPGNVVVLSGRNRPKIDRVLASVNAGLHVLADKPWIVSSDDLPKLDAALATAAKKGLVAYDVMTERFEITTILQRAFVADTAVTGRVVPGTEREPAVTLDSVHYLMKTVAGVPNLRPTWFFDTEQQGEGLADVGTHLVDLVPWILFPQQAIHYKTDIRLLAAERWPTVMSRADFKRVTGASEFPAALAPRIKDGQLQYDGNTSLRYTLRGIHTRVKAAWDFEAAPGAGDTHYAAVRGTRSRIEVRQGPEQKYRTELYIVPLSPADHARVAEAAKARVASLQSTVRGLAIEDTGRELHVIVPEAYRTGHEAHFAEVTREFLGYVRNPKSMPAWEQSAMMAKYYVTTAGVALSRKGK